MDLGWLQTVPNGAGQIKENYRKQNPLILQFCVEEALTMAVKLLLVKKWYFLDCLINAEKF